MGAFLEVNFPSNASRITKSFRNGQDQCLEHQLTSYTWAVCCPFQTM